MQSEFKIARERVVRIFELADTLSSASGGGGSVQQLELESELGCYACILMSGMLEAAFRHYVGQFVKTRAQVELRNYMEWSARGMQNPKHKKVLERLSRFKSENVNSFDQSLEPSWTAAVDSVVELKNKLAHGRRHGTSLAQAKDYFERIEQYINALQSALV